MAKVDLKVRFQHERSTKGAHRYQEVDKDGKVLTTNDGGCVIGTLYLRKDAVGEDAHKTLELSIKSA